MKRIFAIFLALTLLASFAISTSHTSASAKAFTSSFPGNPYGITIEDGSGKSYFTDYAASDFTNVGVNWARTQVKWKDDIETTNTNPPTYSWGILDQAVQTANAHNLLVDFPLQDAPKWHEQSYTCTDKSTVMLPKPQDMANFAIQVAERYDGQDKDSNYTRISSIEIGNEDWFLVSDACKVASFYVPVLRAAYQAIQAVNQTLPPGVPHILVGMFAPTNSSLNVIGQYMSQFYQQGGGAYMDYANFHYYRADCDPSASTCGDSLTRRFSTR